MPTVSIPIKKKVNKQAETVTETVTAPTPVAPKRTNKRIAEKTAKQEIPVQSTTTDTVKHAPREISLGIIDLHPQIAKITQYNEIIYLDVFTTGSTNSSRFEPARTVTITGVENIKKLRDEIDRILADK